MQQREGRSGRSVALLAIPLLVLLWLLWNVAGPDEASTGVAAETPPPAREQPVRVERPVTAEVRADLTEPVPVPVPEPDLEHPFSYALDLRFVDAFGLPVQGALVFAAPPLCGFSLWPNLSNTRGEVRLLWQGRHGRMQLQVATMVWGVLQPFRLFDLDAERTHSQVLVVRGREQPEEALARLRQRTPDNVQEDAQKARRGRMRRTDDLDLICGRTLLLFRDFDCTSCHEQSKIAGYAALARCGVIARGLHPAATFQDLGSALNAAQRKERQTMLEASEEPRLPASGGETGMTYVRGIVREPDGKPAARVPVAWLTDNGALKRRTATNAEGRYRLGPVAPGLQTLVAGGGEGGDARSAVNVNLNGVVDFDFQLERSSVIRGTARDESGNVLVDWRVEFERDEGDWADLAPTHKDGGFLLSSVPGMGRCLLWPSDADLRLPVLFGRAAAPDGDPVAFWLDPQIPTRARLRLRPAFPASKGPLPPVDTRIFQLDTGRGAVLAPMRFDDGLELAGLAPGPYRIEVGAPMLGWVDCGIKHVDGRGLWDLGFVNLPAPGRVRLRTPAGTTLPPQVEHALYRRLESMDVLEQAQEGTDGSLLLPPGEHLLLWRDQEVLRSMSFTVTAGAQVDIDVPAR